MEEQDDLTNALKLSLEESYNEAQLGSLVDYFAQVIYRISSYSFLPWIVFSPWIVSLSSEEIIQVFIT